MKYKLAFTHLELRLIMNALLDVNRSAEFNLRCKIVAKTQKQRSIEIKENMRKRKLEIERKNLVKTKKKTAKARK